jgi:hypothetical protein
MCVCVGVGVGGWWATRACVCMLVFWGWGGDRRKPRWACAQTGADEAGPWRALLVCVCVPKP